LLIVNDFVYRRNRDYYWRCIRCTTHKCRASLILSDNDFVTLCITDHTHPPETEKLKNREKLAFDSSVVAALTPSNKKEKFKIQQEFKQE
jgi:hypothetical protein